MSVRGGAARLPSTSVRALRLTKLFANLPHHEIKEKSSPKKGVY